MPSCDDGYRRATSRASVTVVMSSNSPESTRTGSPAGCVAPLGTGGSIGAVGGGQDETSGEAGGREGHPLAHREGREQPAAGERGDRLIELRGALGEVGGVAVPRHRVVIALDRRAHPGGEVMEVPVAGPPLAGDAIEALGVASQVFGDRPVQRQV